MGFLHLVRRLAGEGKRVTLAQKLPILTSESVSKTNLAFFVLPAEQTEIRKHIFHKVFGEVSNLFLCSLGTLDATGAALERGCDTRASYRGQ